jgi:drug/metabolite transporter (DMT)-like permease
VTPFTAGLLAYMFCDESLTATQILSGIVIVLSCLLILRKVVAPEKEV